MPRIIELPTDTPLSAEDYLVIDDGTTTSKIAVSGAYASATAPGLVSTGAQTFAGNKTVQSNLTVNGVLTANRSGSLFPELVLLSDGAPVGAFTGAKGSSSNAVYIQVAGADLDKRDAFFLPAKSQSDTTNNTYNILTSKSPIAISQGGTGQSGNTKLTPTAGANITINAHSIYRWGNIISGWARFTVNSQIAAYNTYITGLPACRNSCAFPLLNSANIPVANLGAYADEGNTGMRSATTTPTGTYAVSFTYLTSA